jgi:circadian clock protein KaiB
MMEKGINDYDDYGKMEDSFYSLQLYVAGTSPVSVKAIQNLRTILDQHLAGKYELDIIDIHQDPELARKADIAAVPVLIKKIPEPRRLLIGDMSDTPKVLRGLGLTNSAESSET